ncbi:enolase C-terminal domain-like protein [Streptomyces sp. B-S-A8]|uniref:Enolase C-terminal domain-like protein n=1 Tax=Streptomyces solicavernae TaxID=3043614 RepID=A0ABT6S2J6_9ACTN|nr:enolase C-terminal domain-like protein [Streptomyces sp. B-S-A8]MDI3390699.1 enolase C-terminal domain-like protein [Streptomyces sp. B-S-A8]
MFDPAFLKSLTGTPMRVQCAVLPAEPPHGPPADGARNWSVLRVTLRNAGSTGHGDATLLPFLDAHAPDVVRAQLGGARDRLERMISPVDLAGLLPPGPLRSALDAALWDLLAKRSGQRVWELLGVPPPRPVPAVLTLPRGEQPGLEEELRHSQTFAALKLMLGEGTVEDDLARLHAVRRHRPDAWLMADAGGSWGVDRLHTMLPVLQAHGVRLLEQPLPEVESAALAALRRPFPIIADLAYGESGDLGRLASRYDGINLKPDAVGGLTAALDLMRQADQRGLSVLLGAPPATPRSWAAVLHAAAGADRVNFSQWLRTAGDPPCPPAGQKDTDGVLAPPAPSLWG